MKDLLVNPFILSLLLVSSLASLIIIYYLNRDRWIASIFKKIIINLFLFIVSGVEFFPFTHLNIASLGSREKGFFSGVLLLSIYAVIFILLRVRISQILSNIIILFQQNYLSIYLGLIIFSTFWSKTPLLTLKAAISLTLISSFAVYFARAYNWQQIYKLLRFNQVLILFFGSFIAIFLPSLGQTGKGWSGGFGHPIAFGNMMALSASFCLLNAIQNPKYRWLSLVFCVLNIIVMQFSNSATAFIDFLALTAIIFIYPLFRKLNFFQAYILFALVLLIFSVPTIWLISNLDVALSSLNRDLTFTGRVPLWNYLVEEKIKERLWLGYGYSGFWQPWQGSDNPAASVSRLIGDWASHAHNGILELILNVGLIGFIIFAVSFLVNINRAIKLILIDRNFVSIVPLMILMHVFVINLSNEPIIKPSYIWFIYVLITVRLNIDVVNKRQDFTSRQFSISTKLN